ncbi:streptophobe family protein [Streptomyces sp. NPDC056390]|uniref:streptophobe family protein n=1 Tax=Streptomyces sp. NPDC056390 TaxID=3345806 RepID=UPI0035DDD4A3
MPHTANESEYTTMPATTARPRTRPQPESRKPAAPAPPPASGLVRHALEGAGSGLCAVAAMAAVAALALTLLDAGSVGSLWSMTMAVTAGAVGGSLSASAEMSGGLGSAASGLAGLFSGGSGGDMGPSLSGAADVTPLGVTLVGSVVLWLVFSRRLRRRRVDATDLTVRAVGAAAAAWLALLVVAEFAHGKVTLPTSAMGALGGGPGSGTSGDSGAGGLMDSLLGSGAAGKLSMTYDVSAGAVAGGALLWVGIVLGVGCLISPLALLPLGGVLDRLRSAWKPSLSALVRTLLVLAAPLMVLSAFVGTVAGGRAATGAGAALLLAPNALAIFLTTGVGSAWTAGAHPVQSDGRGGLSGLMGAIGGGNQPFGSQTDRTEHLRSLSAGGWPLWLVALTVTGIILLGCAWAAARTAQPAHTLPLHPYRGRRARRLGMAERFGLVTAVVMGTLAWVAGASGNFAISIFGSEMGGMRAELSGGVLSAVALGLLVGGLAGSVGSLLPARRGEGASRKGVRESSSR